METAGARSRSKQSWQYDKESRLRPTGPGPSFPCSRAKYPCTQSQWSNPSAAQMLKQTSFHLISKSQALLDPLHPVSGMGFQNMTDVDP